MRGWIALALAGAAVAAAAAFLVLTFQPLHGGGEGQVRIAIPEGAGVGEIADVLARRGVIGSPFFFEVNATITGSRSKLRPGAYTLRRNMSYAAAIAALAKGPPPPETVSVTIPEGKARREVAPLVADSGLDGDYIKETNRSRELDLRDYDAEDAENLEGFLFPATYELRTGDPVSDLVDEQLQAFEANFGEVNLKDARKANLTPYDVLIIASMVEREAMLDEERPLIASVIYNRLRDGIPLGIDATIRFATNNWAKPLTQSELQLDSPYNTRTNQGLPPGPIGSPGRESLEAAAHPEKTDYLYYVVKPGGCGEHAFSETDAEFQQDVERYNAERSARGGRSPTDCPE